MKNFKIIYKILKALDDNKGNEDFDLQVISPEALSISFREWEQLLIILQDSGYIDGIYYDQASGEKFPHIQEPITPRITLIGMEYLADNSMMAKAKKALEAAGNLL